MNTERIKVWDLPVRLFHWSLVASFVVAVATSESERWRDVHVTAGYTIAGLVAFRLLWGLVGSRHARFADFIPSPSRLKGYLASLLQGRPAHYVGHNPAGAVAILALLACAALAALSGWMTYEEIGGGRIAHAMEEVHEFFGNAMLALVGIHLAGVAVSSLLHRENLVRAMITGWKQRHESTAG